MSLTSYLLFSSSLYFVTGNKSQTIKATIPINYFESIKSFMELFHWIFHWNWISSCNIANISRWIVDHRKSSYIYTYILTDIPSIYAYGRRTNSNCQEIETSQPAVPSMIRSFSWFFRNSPCKTYNFTHITKCILHFIKYKARRKYLE